MQPQTSLAVSAKSNTPSWDVCVQPEEGNHAWEHAAWDNDDNENNPFTEHFFFFLFVTSHFLFSSPSYLNLFSLSHLSPSQRRLLPEVPPWLLPLLFSCSCVEELWTAAASLRWPPFPRPPPSSLYLPSWESLSAALQLGSGSASLRHKVDSAEWWGCCSLSSPSLSEEYGLPWMLPACLSSLAPPCCLRPTSSSCCSLQPSTTASPCCLWSAEEAGAGVAPTLSSLSVRRGEVLSSGSGCPGSSLWVMEKYLCALSWWMSELLGACCWAGMYGMAEDFPRWKPSSLLSALLPGVIVTVVTEALEVTAATDRIREADSGSSLISPPFFSCKNSRSHVRKLGWTKWQQRSWMMDWLEWGSQRLSEGCVDVIQCTVWGEEQKGGE